MGAFPKQGMSLQAVEAELDALLAGDPDELHGRITLYSMKGDAAVQEVARMAHAKFFNHNALMGPRLPSIWTMQQDLYAMAIDLLNGGPDARASMTTGGSESIFCAMHALREWARATRPEVTDPEIVVPYSAHAGFSKACHYLGMRIRRIPLGEDKRADVDAMLAAVGPNTIGLVGSAPAWPHGRYDPIPAIAAVAQDLGIWMHVDACVGGFIGPFAKKLGYPLPEWDLSVPGVCSISADLHKYGFAPKPCSMVLYSSAEYHQYQPHVVEDWPTGPYRTETVVGTRPGGAIAGAWAIMKFLGEEGFLRTTARIMHVKEQLSAGINEIPGLKAWDTDLSLLVYGPETDAFTTEQVAAGMRERGWFIMGVQEPPLIHLNLDPVDDAVIDAYLTDLEKVVADIGAQLGASGELHYA